MQTKWGWNMTLLNCLWVYKRNVSLLILITKKNILLSILSQNFKLWWFFAPLNISFKIIDTIEINMFKIMWLRAEREARSEFFCSLLEKSQYARPDQTQPDPTRPHDAFEKLISLERVDRFTSGLLCSMSPFNKFRIWPVPIPTGACHGTWHVPGRGCRRHPLPR